MALSMQAPVCLVDNGPDGHMRVQQEALQILEQIQQPVVVVAVVGLYRTGKSYLMNRLAGKHTGFALGSTIESKTKGIWMWCVPHPSKPVTLQRRCNNRQRSQVSRVSRKKKWSWKALHRLHYRL
ncbi:hypothetical protein AALO_G00034830 [Alosa alosa]|uniref:GB1/RHD3-type G domain-containing protein n=1 Tax=Alosa alosa TaxID=278164 RepID=A0AAV6H9X2_9TELE|nr:hypothetical protein AALO_G00034830 [Alosa alosa]